MLNLDPLFEAIDLVHLAERAGATLKRQGRSHVGACPLHGGDNPTAFNIFTGKDGIQRWHCFTGCGDGGDAISFVRRWKHLDFVEAVKWLADFARVPMANLGWSTEAAKEYRQQLQIYDVLTWASKFYQSRLWNGEDPLAAAALEYARGRGFSDELLQAARWGFSTSDNALLNAMLAGEDSAEMVPLARKVGLVRSDGRDFTANADGDQVSPDGWLVYPHLRGERVVYFSSRALSPIEKGSKSRNLPGRRQVYRADLGLDGKLLPQDDDLVIVEGPADAETLRAWGWPAWALAGWALNEEEDAALIETLRRQAERNTVYVGLSNDSAGRRGAMEIARLVGPLTRIIYWPKPDDAKKADANDWLQRGATCEDADSLLTDAKPYVDLVIEETAITHDVRDHAEKLEHLADLVAQLGETERAIYIRTIGEDRRLGVGTRDFSHMVAERMPRQKNSGIEVLDGEFTFWGEPLCNFTAHIAHELMKDDGQEVTIHYTVVGKLAAGKPLPPFELQADDFDKMRWIGPNWGARPIVYVGNNKLHVLRRAILERSIDDMTRERIHTCTGWYQFDDRRVFLTTSGVLSAAGLDESIRVDLANNLVNYHLPTPPVDRSELIEALRASLAFMDIAPMEITAPIWAAMYAAPLTEIKSLNAVLWVYGPTQSKKSSISHLALAHFGEGFVKGRDYKAPTDWTSTQAELEGIMFTCKDVPVILDDYAPQFTTASESRDMGKKAHYVVRSVGNRSSRGRRRADMTSRKSFPPRGLAIATAEQPLTGQSIVGRTITIPVEINSIDLDKLSYSQGHHHLYSRAMAAYVVWLAENWNRLADEIPHKLANLQAEVGDRFRNQDRLVDYYAILVTSADLTLRWMAQAGAIDDEEMHILKCTEAIYNLLIGQSGRISAESPVIKFFQALDDLQAQGKVVFASREPEYTPPFGSTLVGWKVPEYDQVYLLTATALIEVKGYWAGLDERFDTLIDALRRELDQHGYLVDRAPRQFEPNKWINTHHGSRRVAVIDVNLVRDRCGVDLLQRGENDAGEGQ